ncbi:MscL family protein [Mycoplasmopsis fermentans]|uniref:Large conductance mechanosensitive channel n=2 Tax=Mycoplasmopsis fermentans TaxID=2115 RepID=C4XES9_MYCFP|nr:MscL family protein [Mycoplasmopsis fermentans]VEU67516.1 large conductance mechanosensitive channel protein [Mesomycoplasma conjunctivae]ADN68928.1 large-conductance mechanosensitive channel [Mycoplasmopsis fermentans JER]ADV34351.1 Large-conductance mechanosensitive channel [Mycoplasmopsis fermentans M64]VEU60374.1 large conductance mechanosensitive channel protein [Mycoplasmopsis fermentans]BAH69651.1 hypothetical protein MBIO_0386 [Mycoplasmopsis fermentans PG18]
MFKKSCKDAWIVVKRGNMFMLAIGLLLGTAFNAVVSSLANDVIMAAIAKAFNVDEVKDLKAGPILIGKFLAALISFLIVATVIFILLVVVFLVKNAIETRKFKKNPPVAEEPKPTTEELILAEIKKLNERLEKLEQPKK